MMLQKAIKIHSEDNSSTSQPIRILVSMSTKDVSSIMKAFMSHPLTILQSLRDSKIKLVEEAGEFLCLDQMIMSVF